MRARIISLIPIALLLASAAQAQEAIPFRTRNLNPLVSVFGLPAWHVPNESLEIDVATDIANHYRLSGRGPDRLISDGETIRTHLFIAKRFNDRLSLTFELPYYRIYGGVLDDVIDSWHSIFGLPDGGRNNRPENAVEFEFARNNDVFYRLNARATGLGDAQLGLSWSIGSFGVASANVKLATGDEDLLAGSGSTDWSVSFLRPREVQLSTRTAGYYWGFGVIRVGEGPAQVFDQRDSGYFGVLGGSLRITPRLGARVQIDMHSPFYRSQLEEIGEKAFQGSIGGWWEFSERGVFEFAFNEDVHVSTSPDIVVHLNARWTW
jgi:hypothetical protein